MNAVVKWKINLAVVSDKVSYRNHRRSNGCSGQPNGASKRSIGFPNFISIHPIIRYKIKFAVKTKKVGRIAACGTRIKIEGHGSAITVAA